jgi:hypothetical protein
VTPSRPQLARIALVALTTAVVAALVGAIVASRVGGGGDDRREPAFFGVNVPNASPSLVARFGNEIGCKPRVVNRFVKLDSTFSANDLRKMSSTGQEPMISLEPWSYRSTRDTVDLPAYRLSAVASGRYDSQLEGIARLLASYGKPVLLRFAHEMNATWYPWGVGVNGNHSSDYVDAWRHVHDVMSSIAPNLRWVWAPASTWWDDPLPLSKVYPGDEYVDYVAVSGYGHDGTAEDTYGAWYTEVRTITDKPAILSEIGADGSDKAAWIASLGDFVAEHPDIVGFVWFNTTPESTGATGDYALDSSEDVTAFRRTLGRLDACSRSR